MKKSFLLLLVAFLIPSLVIFDSFAESQTLPPGWKEWHTRDGKVYYQKPDGTTTWTAPGEPEAPPPPPEEMKKPEEAPQQQHNRRKTGFFMGVGAIAGFESNVIQAFAGGLSGQTGWQLNNRIALLLESDIVFLDKSGVFFVAVPFIPTIKVNFYKDLFGSAGFGYIPLFTSGSASFDGFTVSGSANFNGWIANGAVGYDVWLGDRFSFSPQVGLDFARLAGSNLFVPNVRLNFNYHF